MIINFWQRRQIFQTCLHIPELLRALSHEIIIHLFDLTEQHISLVIGLFQTELTSAYTLGVIKFLRCLLRLIFRFIYTSTDIIGDYIYIRKIGDFKLILAHKLHRAYIPGIFLFLVSLCFGPFCSLYALPLSYLIFF